MLLTSSFADLKDVLEVTLHLSRDALHVHVGLMIFLACAWLYRGPRRLLLAFGTLLGLCVLGEVADLSEPFRHGYRLNWLASGKDIVNTMFWPGLWLLAGPQVVRLLAGKQVEAGKRIEAGKQVAPDQPTSAR
jgi:hypothetical protein